MHRLFLILAMVGALLLPAMPAQAASVDTLTCSYTNSPHPTITGYLAVSNDNGLWKATGNLVDDNGPHNWNYQFFHNGSVFEDGYWPRGSFDWTAWTFNASGDDTIRWHVYNDSQSIVCNAKVVMP